MLDSISSINKKGLMITMCFLQYFRMRLGLVSGPKPILDRISLHMQASVMHASGLSQVN